MPTLGTLERRYTRLFERAVDAGARERLPERTVQAEYEAAEKQQATPTGGKPTLVLVRNLGFAWDPSRRMMRGTPPGAHPAWKTPLPTSWSLYKSATGSGLLWTASAGKYLIRWDPLWRLVVLGYRPAEVTRLFQNFQMGADGTTPSRIVFTPEGLPDRFRGLTPEQLATLVRAGAL